MAAQGWARRIDAKLRPDRARLAAVETRLDRLSEQLAALEQTVAAADPATTRRIVEALQADVASMAVDVNVQLGRAAAQAPQG